MDPFLFNPNQFLLDTNLFHVDPNDTATLSESPPQPSQTMNIRKRSLMSLSLVSSHLYCAELLIGIKVGLVCNVAEDGFSKDFLKEFYWQFVIGRRIDWANVM